MVLNLWAVTLSQGFICQVCRARYFHYKSITVAELGLRSSKENTFTVGGGVTTTGGAVLKGHRIRKVGNHCVSGRRTPAEAGVD